MNDDKEQSSQNNINEPTEERNLIELAKEIDAAFEVGEKYELRFTAHRNLWKIDNKEWMDQRRDQWRALAKIVCPKCKAKEIKYFGRFFLTGEEYSGHPHMDLNIRFILTPFETPETAKELFELIGQATNMHKVASGFMPMACKNAKDMPWLRQKVQCFSKGVLGERYKKMTRKLGAREEVVSPEPSTFCADFVDGALLMLQAKIDYHFCLDTVSYFVSALPYVTNTLFRPLIKLEEMYKSVENVLQYENKLEQDTLKLAQTLKSNRNQIMKNWLINEELNGES